jgi:hypothetical protein
MDGGLVQASEDPLRVCFRRCSDRMGRRPQPVGHSARLALLPKGISLFEVGADFPFPRGAAPQSDGREQAQLLAERAEPASAEGRSLSLVWRSSTLLSTASSSSDSPGFRRSGGGYRIARSSSTTRTAPSVQPELTAWGAERDCRSLGGSAMSGADGPPGNSELPVMANMCPVRLPGFRGFGLWCRSASNAPDWGARTGGLK